MFKVKSLLLVIVTGLLCACTGNNPSVTETEAYTFTMYDSLNSVIAKGVMEVDERINEKLSGTYSFTSVITEFTGYGAMKKGKFTGKINKEENMILIDTNPGVADNNVYFNVKVWQDRLEGDWYYTGLRQNMTYNKVVLTKK
jgi:hypothetical protein